MNTQKDSIKIIDEVIENQVIGKTVVKSSKSEPAIEDENDLDAMLAAFNEEYESEL